MNQTLSVPRRDARQNEPLPGDTGWGDFINHLVPHIESRGASVVPGSLDLDGVDAEWGEAFVSYRHAGSRRAWIVVDGRITGEARLIDGALTITERFDGATPGTNEGDAAGRAPSDQWPELPIVIPIDVEPVTLRLGPETDYESLVEVGRGPAPAVARHPDLERLDAIVRGDRWAGVDPQD